MKEKVQILLVDDQPQNIELIETCLVPKGYEIIKAKSGDEALLKLDCNNIDLILLDVMMPEMDGYEVMQRIRQNHTHKHLPIILVTSLRETEDRVRGINAGCDDFLSMPIDKMELLARVQSLLRVKIYYDLMSEFKKKFELTKIFAEIQLEFAENIIDTVREPLIVLDHELRVIKANHSFYEVFKVVPNNTIGQLIYDLGNKQWDIPQLRELLETILPKQTILENYEVEHNFVTIGKRVMLLNGRQIKRGLDKEPIILLAIEDVTERKFSEENYRHLALHDTLTGLPNRKLFSDRMEIAFVNAKRYQKFVGIAMVDLDNFKDVNDTLGHDIGDELLIETSKHIGYALRKGDTIARFGGDEFVLIFPDLVHTDDVISVAQKIINIFKNDFLIGHHQILMTISIGIAFYPKDATDERTLLKMADIAMYKAKQSGRAQFQLYNKS